MSPFDTVRRRWAARKVRHYIEPTFRDVGDQERDAPNRRTYRQLVDLLASGAAQTWFIEGSGGSGKSSLTIHVADALLEQEFACVFVDRQGLARIRDADLDVRDFAKHHACPAEVAATLWKARVKQGRCVLVVDAVNELEREFHGTSAWSFVREVLDGGHRFPVLATSRFEPGDIGSLLRARRRLSMVALTEEESTAYLVDRGIEQATFEHVIRATGLGDATWNPFLLSLLADLIVQQTESGELKPPRSRAELLQATVDRVRNERRITRAEDALAGRGFTIEATLCAAALAVYLSPRAADDFPYADLVALLARVWRDPGDAEQMAKLFLDTQMVARVGDAGTGGVYQLMHPSLVDFGMALGWRGRPPSQLVLDGGELDQCLGNMVGLQPDPDAEVRRLIADTDTPVAPHILLDVCIANRGTLSDATLTDAWSEIGRALVSARAIRDRVAQTLGRLPFRVVLDGVRHGLLRALRKQSEPLADRALEWIRAGRFDSRSFQAMRMRDQRNQDTRRSGANARQGRGDSEAFDRQRTLLATSPDALVRRRSAMALSAGECGMVLDPLLAAFAVETDAVAKGAIATALGRVGDKAATKALCAALGDHAAPANVRGSAAHALGLIGDRAAVGTLCETLVDHAASGDIRGSSAHALGMIGDRAAVHALCDVLVDPKDSANVRGSSANALGQIKERSAAAIDALCSVLVDRAASADIRGSAAHALGQIGDRAAVAALCAAVSDANDASNVRGSAANALGEIGDSGAVAALCVALGDRTAPDNVRGSVANALGKISDRDAVVALCATLGDRTAPDDVRGSAANALGLIGDRAAVEALCAAVVDEGLPFAVRGSASNALGKVGDSAAVETLCNVLKDATANDGVRGSSANALGLIGDRSAVAALCVALVDRSAADSVRGSSANALGQIGDRAAVDALCVALVDRSAAASIRGSAANALGMIGDRAAVAALCLVVAEDGASAALRGSAANALGEIGDRTAVDALCAVLNDRTVSDDVRGSVANALGRIGDAAALPAIRSLVQDDRVYTWTRSAAVGALFDLSRETESWLMPLADRLRYVDRADLDGARRLRGVIVNYLSRRSADVEIGRWIDGVAQLDSDPLNRVVAVRGLSTAKLISEERIRYLIDPHANRRNGKTRDTDDSVCGEAAAAAIRMMDYDAARASTLLPVVAELLSNRKTWSTTHRIAFAPLRDLSVDLAARVIDELQRAADAAPECSRYFHEALDDARALLASRNSVIARYVALQKHPEELLMNFRNQAKSRFETDAVVAQDPSVDVALLTAIPVETKAVVTELARMGVAARMVQKNGRFYDSFDLENDRGAVRVVLTQAVDKGGQPSAAAARELIADFKPTLVLLVGVAGGFAERGVKLFDVVVAKNIFNYDPERLQSVPGGARPQVYRTDPQVLGLVNYLSTHDRLAPILDGSAVHQKDYASGEKVIAWREAELRQRILDLSIDVYGVETEGHGVMHAIWETFQKDRFVGGAMIKCISDLGDEEMGVDKGSKQLRAATKAARVALSVAAQFRRE